MCGATAPPTCKWSSDSSVSTESDSALGSATAPCPRLAAVEAGLHLLTRSERERRARGDLDGLTRARIDTGPSGLLFLGEGAEAGIGEARRLLGHLGLDEVVAELREHRVDEQRDRL